MPFPLTECLAIDDEGCLHVGTGDRVWVLDPAETHRVAAMITAVQAVIRARAEENGPEGRTPRSE